MSLNNLLREKLTQARRARNTLEMGILQVVLGAADMDKARTGNEASDEDMERIIRKLETSINESMDIFRTRNLTASEEFAKLRKENEFISTILPKTLSVADIKLQLDEVKDAVASAKSDGQATGVAVKHLKTKGLKALGEHVAAAVKELRTGD